MKKEQILISLFLFNLVCFLLCSSTIYASEETPPDEAINLAENFFEKLIPKIKSGDFSMYIKADEEVNSMIIGSSYKNYLFDGQKLTSGELLESCIKFDKWSFLVVNNEDIRLVIHVAEREGKWEISGFGKPLGALRDLSFIWPSDKGYSFSVAKLPGKCVLAYTINEKEMLFYPLTNGTANLFNVTIEANNLYPILSKDEVTSGLIRALNM